MISGRMTSRSAGSRASPPWPRWRSGRPSAAPWTVRGPPPRHRLGRRAPRRGHGALPRRRLDRAAALRGAGVARRRGGAPLLGTVRVRRGSRAGGAAHGGARAVRRVGDAAHLDRRLARGLAAAAPRLPAAVRARHRARGWLVRALARDARGAARRSPRRAPPWARRPRSGNAELGPLWLLGTVFSIVLTAFFVFIKRFVDETGIGSVGLFFSAYTGAALALRIFLGWLPDRVGPKRVLGPALVALTLGFAVMTGAADGAQPAARGRAVRHRPRLHVPDPVRARGEPDARGEPRLDARAVHGAVRSRRADRRPELRPRDRALRLRRDVRARRASALALGTLAFFLFDAAVRAAQAARVRRAAAARRCWRSPAPRSPRPSAPGASARTSGRARARGAARAAAGRSRRRSAWRSRAARRPRKSSALDAALRAWEAALPGLRLPRAGGGAAAISVRFVDAPVPRADGTLGTGRTIADCRLGVAGRARGARGGERRDRAAHPARLARARARAHAGGDAPARSCTSSATRSASRGTRRPRTTRSARAPEAARRAGARALAGEPLASPALAALYARPSGEVLASAAASSAWRTLELDRLARLARANQLDGPYLRAGDAVGRIFWRDERGREWGFLVAGLARARARSHAAPAPARGEHAQRAAAPLGRRDGDR